MTNKRRRDVDFERRAKRRRKRSSSEPPCDTESPEKRQALNRLFGRICSIAVQEKREKEPEFASDQSDESDYDDDDLFEEENGDALLDSVPVDMDPEQLGFLVCAQETLRFLYRRGIHPSHPVFARLRSRFLRGIDEMAVA